MKKVIGNVIKWISAALVALLILSVISFVYYTLPMRDDNPNHNTDYVYESNSIWLRMTEGISFGKVDANGFNNAKAIQSPDILVLGSSHMMAFEVNQDQNMAYCLGRDFSDKYTVYNMGMSAHPFEKVCHYLPDTLGIESMHPKYVVIETAGTTITHENAAYITAKEKSNNGSVKNNALIRTVQRIPFVRLIYYQLNNGFLDRFKTEKGHPSDAKASDDTAAAADSAAGSPSDYSEVFHYLNELQKEYGTKIIIVYHPTETFYPDGTVTFETTGDIGLFSKAAAQNDVSFIDLTESFDAMYRESRQVPHGFITGKIGAGHLNRYGHQAMADEVYRYITEYEEANHAND